MNVGYPILEGASIPGDPDGLLVISRHFQTAQTDVFSVQERVEIDRLLGWTGPAANSFRLALDKLPHELQILSDAFEAASGSIRGFAAKLVDVQSNASYYANRISNLEDDLGSAQRRQDEAQAHLDSARFHESAATDPISLKTAVAAVKDGLSKLKIAVDDIEANRGEIARLRREAHINRADYEQAVSACSEVLQNVTSPGERSSGAPRISVGTLIAGLVGTLLHDLRSQGSGGTTSNTPKKAPVNPAITSPVATTATAPAPLATSTDLTASSGWTASQIDHDLSGTIFAGLGASFISAEKQYHVSAVFLVALAINETGSQPNDIVLVKHNIFGYGAYGANSYTNATAFPSYAACIDFVAQKISVNYLTPGGAYYHGPTLTGMNVKYASSKTWASQIASIANNPEGWASELP